MDCPTILQSYVTIDRAMIAGWCWSRGPFPKSPGGTWWGWLARSSWGRSRPRIDLLVLLPIPSKIEQGLLQALNSKILFATCEVFGGNLHPFGNSATTLTVSTWQFSPPNWPKQIDRMHRARHLLHQAGRMEQASSINNLPSGGSPSELWKATVRSWPAAMTCCDTSSPCRLVPLVLLVPTDFGNYLSSRLQSLNSKHQAEGHNLYSERKEGLGRVPATNARICQDMSRPFDETDWYMQGIRFATCHVAPIHAAQCSNHGVNWFDNLALQFDT